MHRVIGQLLYLLVWGSVRLANRTNIHQIIFEKHRKLKLLTLLGSLLGLLGDLLGRLEAILKPNRHQYRLQDELEKKAQGKDAFLVKQDFMNRVDHRKFELEKEERDRERAKRATT